MLLLRSLILTLFMSLSAHAAGSVTEQSVFELSVDVKTLLLKYYHVQADEGNPQLIEELLRHRDLVASEHTSLVAQLDEKYAVAGSNIQTHWTEFNRLLDQNVHEIREANYPELQVVTLMRQAQRSLLGELELLAENLLMNNEVALPELVIWQREQKNLLLNVVERYIERAASSMGAPLTVDSVDISSLCRRFDLGIADLRSRVTSTDAQRQLDKIRSQWLFIETAATDAEARLVPFLVMRYTDRILSRLDGIALHI